MTAQAPMPPLQQRPVPRSIRELCPFDADYADTFTIGMPADSTATAEQWARAAMEGVSAAGRFACWRLMLGLRLEPQGPADIIAGWRVAARGPDWIRLEARSWFLTANVVWKLEADALFFATLVRYDRRVAALVWPAVSVVHQAAAPGLLRHGRNRIRRRGDG